MKVKARTDRRGFTLPEVLLVVVIIGLIAGAGTGLYLGTFRRMQVEKAAQNFLLTAKYARMMAIERQGRYKMELDVANNGFWLTTSVQDEEDRPVGQEIVKNLYCRPVQLEGDVVFEAVEVAPSGWETEQADEQLKTIVFSPNGTAQSAVVQIGDGKTHYTTSIGAATARAKLYFGTAENVRIGTIDLDAE